MRSRALRVGKWPRWGDVSRRAAGLLVLDLVLGLTLLAVLAFAPLAHLVAEGLPRVPGATVRVLASSGPDGAVRPVPAGLPTALTVEHAEDVTRPAQEALGDEGARALLRLVRHGAPLLAETAVGGALGFAPYPYRYPAMIRLLAGPGRRAGVEELTALGAALMQLSSRTMADGSLRSRNAAPAAYAVLDSARDRADPAGVGCLAQLNLTALVAADRQPRDPVVAREASRFRMACPGDPTGDWLLGQYYSQRATRDPDPEFAADLDPDREQARATVTFDRLVTRFPRSADVRTGAADAALRLGLRLRDLKPFTARYHLQNASVGYRAALRSGRDSGAGSGLARSLLGMGRTREAEEVLTEVTRGVPTAGPDLEVLLETHETARDFAAAAALGQSLAGLGEAAYPQGRWLFPVPGVYTAVPGSDDAVLGPLSLQATRAARFTIDLQPEPGGAGATVEDSSFIPVYRDDPGYTGTDPRCPEWAWRRDALLAGHAEGALADYPKSGFQFPDHRPDNEDTGCGPDLDEFRALVQAEAGLPYRLKWQTPEAFADRRQNMWRWAGQLRRARDVVAAWPKPARGTSHLPAQRRGEIDFLSGRHDDAAAAFGAAARRSTATTWNDAVTRSQTMLNRGVALLAAGRRSEGMAVLQDVERIATIDMAYQQQEGKDLDSARRFGVVAYHARARMADDLLGGRKLHAAAELYEAAAELVPVLEELGATGLHPDAVHANLATAQIRLGRNARARASIGRALAHDSRSPAYLMTAGFAALRAGDRTDAVRLDRAALDSDPGAFPAANDLGVLQARLGDQDAAEAALRQAVGARPDYALGWFNLGVLYSRDGIAHALSAQGALARAFKLDPVLEERERELTIDAATYRSGLDLSRPLPPRWSLARVQERAPATSLGLLAALWAAAGLARISRASATEWVERLAEPAASRLERLPGLRRLRSPAWAVVTAVVLLSLPLAEAGPPGSALMLFVVGIVVISLSAIRARWLVARRNGARERQVTWPPALALGLLTVPIGSVIAPLPVVDGEASPKTHAAAPLVTAGLSLVLLVEAVLTRVPLAQSLAVATLVLSASTLLPVGPLDGARLNKVGLGAGIGLLGLGLLLALGLG